MTVTERFLKYVSYETTSDEESGMHPSSPKELELAKVLFDELSAMGLEKVHQDEHGYVYGILPGNDPKKAPIGLISHMDTSPAVSGKDIKPKTVLYEGGDIRLSDTVSISESVYEFLPLYRGKHLIVTDGTTLLGADDKAGTAEIFQAIEYVIMHPEVKHGDIYVCVTPDEEIGEGTMFFDLDFFKADYAYTVDGGRLGGLEYENFNAAHAVIKVHGINIHPGSAKNKMKNATLYASEFIEKLPKDQTPATTEGYEGFFHVCGISGDESKAVFDLLIRDHDKKKFNDKKVFLSKLADEMNQKYGEGTFECVLQDSYYNMKEKIEPVMFIIERAEKAMKDCGVKPFAEPIRGGTDGAMLSFKGLPCPNLSTGGENYHSIHEFVCVEDMEKMVEVLANIIGA